MTDVFAVQDEIADAIATRLRGTMHGEADRAAPRGGTKNLEAYELLLQRPRAPDQARPLPAAGDRVLRAGDRARSELRGGAWRGWPTPTG